MSEKVVHYEANPSSQFPIEELGTPEIVNATNVLLHSLIGIDRMPFIEREGFRGLSGAVDSMLENMAPQCKPSNCGLKIWLEGTPGGHADETTLRLSCPRIQKTSEAEASSIESRCTSQHQEVAKWFGVWVTELARSIEVTEQSRATAERQEKEMRNKLWEMLH